MARKFIRLSDESVDRIVESINRSLEETLDYPRGVIVNSPRWYRTHVGNFAVAGSAIFAAIIAGVIGGGAGANITADRIENIQEARIDRIEQALSQTIYSEFPAELTEFVQARKSELERSVNQLSEDNSLLSSEVEGLREIVETITAEREKLREQISVLKQQQSSPK